jgi:hypothetical protein
MEAAIGIEPMNKGFAVLKSLYQKALREALSSRKMLPQSGTEQSPFS